MALGCSWIKLETDLSGSFKWAKGRIVCRLWWMRATSGDKSTVESCVCSASIIFIGRSKKVTIQKGCLSKRMKPRGRRNSTSSDIFFRVLVPEAGDGFHFVEQLLTGGLKNFSLTKSDTVNILVYSTCFGWIIPEDAFQRVDLFSLVARPDRRNQTAWALRICLPCVDVKASCSGGRSRSSAQHVYISVDLFLTFLFVLLLLHYAWDLNGHLRLKSIFSLVCYFCFESYTSCEAQRCYGETAMKNFISSSTCPTEVCVIEWTSLSLLSRLLAKVSGACLVVDTFHHENDSADYPPSSASLLANSTFTLRPDNSERCLVRMRRCLSRTKGTLLRSAVDYKKHSRGLFLCFG